MDYQQRIARVCAFITTEQAHGILDSWSEGLSLRQYLDYLMPKPCLGPTSMKDYMRRDQELVRLEEVLDRLEAEISVDGLESARKVLRSNGNGVEN